jgi:mannosyltransferase OCH1-like enzyme
MNIAKKIWFLWFQGIESAPEIVKQCLESWIRKNPEWEVIVLDSHNLNKYIQIEFPPEVINRLSSNHLSNMIRLQLLREYGGVWVDATLYCMKSLDDWLWQQVVSGFFAFRDPGKDRELSNWFMASQAQSVLIKNMTDAYRAYWIENEFVKPTVWKHRWVVVLSFLFNRHKYTTRYWKHPFVTKLLKVYPYFIFHYIFNHLVRSEKSCKLIWKQTPKISADGPHRIQSAGMYNPLNKEIKEEIDSCIHSLYKLSWKEAPTDLEGTNLDIYFPNL